MFKKEKILFYRNDLLLSLFTLPIYFMAAGYYGYRIIILLGLSLITGFITEKTVFKLTGEKKRSFGFVNWFLFPLFFPPAFPIYLSIISIFFGILIATSFFGGHGRAMFSPIPIGMTFANLSFTNAYAFGWARPFGLSLDGFRHFWASVLIIDHPVDFYMQRGTMDMRTLLTGLFPTSPINTVPLLLIIIALLLLIIRAIDGKCAIIYFITIIIFQHILNLFFPHVFKPIKVLFLGHLIGAVIFIFADNRYLPRTDNGRIIAAFLLAFFSILILNFSAFSEGIFFAILLINIFSGLIDELTISIQYRRIES